MSCVLNIDRFIIPNDVIVMLTDIYRWVGTNKQFSDVVTSNIDRVIDQTIERDTYFLSRILNLEISDSRSRLIITKDSNPRNKEETTLYNLKETLIIFQKKYSQTRFQSNDLLNIINYVYSHYSGIKFEYLPVEKRAILQSQAMKSKRLILDDVYQEIEKNLDKKSFEKISLFLNFFVDFYNIAPFTSHNETANYLLLYLLILKCDLESFRYISFFELIYDNFDEFEKELKNASFNWKEGYAQTLGFIRFMCKLFIRSYEKTSEVIKDYKFDLNLNKSNNIENTISKMPETFTKDEIRLLHPYVSESTINRALTKLRDEGVIKPLGKGRSAKWIRIYRGFTND